MLRLFASTMQHSTRPVVGIVARSHATRSAVQPRTAATATRGAQRRLFVATARAPTTVDASSPKQRRPSSVAAVSQPLTEAVSVSAVQLQQEHLGLRPQPALLSLPPSRWMLSMIDSDLRIRFQSAESRAHLLSGNSGTTEPKPSEHVTQLISVLSPITPVHVRSESVNIDCSLDALLLLDRLRRIVSHPITMPNERAPAPGSVPRASTSSIVVRGSSSAHARASSERVTQCCCVCLLTSLCSLRVC